MDRGEKMVTKEKLVEIKSLRGFQLKLNFDMLESRPENSKDDIFHYEDGQLVGFLGSYGFGNKVELCGMVHPDFRRKGIFTSLLQKGLEQAIERNSQTILLNAPTKSQSAKEFLKTVPCTFSFAEYQMKWWKAVLTEDPSITIRRSVSDEDLEAEVQLEVRGFGFKEEEAREFNKSIRESGTDQNFIIEAAGKTAGKIRVSELNGEAWIYGFAVFPELQGRGIGRRALSKVVIEETRKGFPVFLEVEARNSNALGLYESCGFRAYHSQDYYKYHN